jgi:hypothetical protein
MRERIPLRVDWRANVRHRADPSRPPTTSSLFTVRAACPRPPPCIVVGVCPFASAQPRRTDLASSQSRHQIVSERIRSDPYRTVAPVMPELAPPPQPVVVVEKDGAPANVDGSEGSESEDCDPDDLASEEEEEEDGNGYSYGYGDDDFPDLDAKPLFKAIWSGKPLSVLKAIVKRRPDSVMGTCTGEFPLHHAVLEGLPLAHVKFLYCKYPDAIYDNLCCERLPLHFISGETPVDVVQFLVDECPEALRLEGDSGDCLLPIHGGVANAGVGVVQVLVERYPKSLMEFDGDGYLPIHLAATATRNPHQLEVVKYLAQQCVASLLQRGQMEANQDYDENGSLTIHLAARSTGPQQLAVVRFLAEACPESLGMTAHGASLPVHRALQSNPMPSVIKLLVRLTPIPDEAKVGLLHFAVRHSYKPDTVFALAELLPGTLRSKDGSGSLPIHAAVEVAFRKRCKALREVVLCLATMDPDALLLPDANGRLPLHIAINRNCQYDDNVDLACLLLERCPQAATRGRRLPMHDAIRASLVGLVRLMARLVPETLERTDASGWTPLHVAVSLPRAAGRDPDGWVLAMANLLIESRPGSLTVPDANLDLPLHVAIARSSDAANGPSAESAWSVELVTTLLDRCPGSIRTKGAGGMLPVHVAASLETSPLPLVQLLVQRCPESLEVKDGEGKLPLHVAVCKDRPSLPLIQLLVEGRPELLGRADSEGNVAFVLAAEKARFRAADTTTQTASLDLIYWLVRTNPESVASHPTH